MDNGDEIVGHKTMADGSHQPLTRREADEIWARAKAAEAKRASDMPTEQDAIYAMCGAYQRLRELGWKEIIYCPKDGSVFDAVEAGSSGIHRCVYHGKWPDGSWWVLADGDQWPSMPVLFRPDPTP